MQNDCFTQPWWKDKISCSWGTWQSCKVLALSQKLLLISKRDSRSEKPVDCWKAEVKSPPPDSDYFLDLNPKHYLTFCNTCGFALLLFFPCATFPALVTEAVDLESRGCSPSGIQHEELHVLSRGFRKQRVDRVLGGPQTLMEYGSSTLEVTVLTQVWR